MRMPAKTGYSTGLRISKDSSQHYVELWRQPLHQWLLVKIYHRYDMTVFRIPGFQRLERWIRNRAGDWTYIPIGSRQDIRCFHLTQRKRTTLARFDISEELANQIRMRL